jgi:hypothetical protein
MPGSRIDSASRSRKESGPFQRFLRRWFIANSAITGLLALIWLLVRSGPKPSRLAYPCQQAACSTALLALAAPAVSALIAARQRVVAGLKTRVGMAVVALGIVAPLCVWGTVSRFDGRNAKRLLPPADYRAQVFNITDCPEDLVGDRFPGLDSLLELMGRNGVAFYRSSTSARTAGPEGIIAADDVVIIKINYQWAERGGTSTDLLRGLIQAIVSHPDGFTGEIVVCENTQFQWPYDFDRSENNSQDQGQSPLDVVTDFADQGYAVSVFDWTAIRYTAVYEFSEGDTTDGYVVYDRDDEIRGRVSYPKFTTAFGTAISLRDGVWSASQDSYDREHLRFINVPVLKSHSSTYGATACVKNYMGVVTDALGTDSHEAIRYGILGALMSEIRPADLNILDCIWINADPYDGPRTGYDQATRMDQLVASTDPVAADIWAVTNILVPAFQDNGFSPPWPNPDATPDDPSSDFRRYLDNSMQQLLAGGFAVTNDFAAIDAYSWDGIDYAPKPRRVLRRRAPRRP